MFPPNPGTFRFSEGPLSPDWLPARGRVNAVLVFVDFPDAPGGNVIDTLVRSHTAQLAWFDEASYGRFGLSVTPVTSWFRLPRPTTSYSPLPGSVHHPDLFADAIAAADAAVDFSAYRAVIVAGARGWSQGVAGPFLASSGSGVRADGTEIRYGVVLGPSILDSGTPGNTVNHEFLHTLGLPDVHGGASTVGSWDPMAQNSATHLLGWHKWLLGWLDPAQLSCQLQPGTREETLGPLHTPGGKKLVVVPTSATTAHAIEVRRRGGYDGGICKEGVLVYRIDSLTPSAQGPISVGNREGGCFPAGSPYVVGGVFDDAAVKVEVLASDGRAYRIRVTRK